LQHQSPGQGSGPAIMAKINSCRSRSGIAPGVVVACASWCTQALAQLHGYNSTQSGESGGAFAEHRRSPPLPSLWSMSLPRGFSLPRPGPITALRFADRAEVSAVVSGGHPPESRRRPGGRRPLGWLATRTLPLTKRMGRFLAPASHRPDDAHL